MSEEDTNIDIPPPHMEQTETQDQTDHEEVRIHRERKQTQKFIEYQHDTHEQNFKHAVSAWRRNATHLEKIMSDCKDIPNLRKERNALESNMQRVTEAFERLIRLVPSTQDGQHSLIYEQIELDNYNIAKQMSDCIRVIESEKLETSSRTSRYSTSSRGRLDAAAEAAALKAKLQFMDQEGKVKMEFEQKRLELEQKRMELEKTQAKRDFDMAQAKLDAIVKFETEETQGYSVELPTVSKTDLVLEYVKSQNNPTSDISTSNVNIPHKDISHELSPSAPPFYPPTQIDPNQPTPLPYNIDPTFNRENIPHSSPPKPNFPNNTAGMEDVVRLLAEQVNIGRLPPPEPGIFVGDPLSYPSWKGSFMTLIGRRQIPACEQIYYLKKYLGGQAKEAVEGYLLISTDNAYQEAMDLLEQRYGDPFVVANAFREKLDAWPKIGSRDGIALRKLSDFLRQCCMAMQTIQSLHVLNDDRENKKILMKLPDWLTLRWGRIVSEWRQRHRLFPPFAVFADFIAKEANIACDPVTSLQSLNSIKGFETEDRYSAFKTDRRRSSGHRAYATETNTSHSFDNSKPPKPCILCKKMHGIDTCYEFMKKNLQERKDFAMKTGLCFGCLEQGHRSRDCNQRKTCKICSKQHPTPLHGDFRMSNKTTKQDYNKTEGTHVGISHLSDSGMNCKCSMIVPVWLSHQQRPDHEILVYALLDTQSDTTFILDKTCNDLQIDGTTVNLLLSTMTAENQIVSSRKFVGLRVRGHDSNLTITLPTTYSRDVMPSNRSHIPTPDIAKQWPHLRHIADKIMPLCDSDVGLLIGYNCSRALAPRDVIATAGNEPYGQRTDLGWGIVGIAHPDQHDYCDNIGLSHRILSSLNTSSTTDSVKAHVSDLQISLQTTIKEVISPADVTRMMELDFNERYTDTAAPSHNDLRFFNIMKEGIHLTEDKHYEMPLPLANPDMKLPNNRTMAMRRLKHLKSRFGRDMKYRKEYVQFMQNVITDEYAERVPENELKNDLRLIWYIPHHGVYHPKKPEKIRVVFDCSAKYAGQSLNDNLLQGPDLMNNLTGVLCRFRQEQVAFICDVEQMFFQFQVNEDHRDLLRFLWWDNDNLDGDPVDFRMKVHLFGAASTPACANYGLKQAATDNEETFGSLAADFMRQDFYVDDGLKSVSSVKDAIDLISNTQKICQNGGLRLHKITSNRREVISSVAIEDRAKGIQDLDLFHDNLPTERALGIHWCTNSDTFGYNINLKDRPITRRGILSTISSIYDPIGFLAPVLLVGKQILQQLCRDNADWDSDLPDDLKVRWEQWRDQLLHLEQLKIPRCVKPADFEPETVELHHFSDASTCGYGQCSYIRFVDNNSRVHCSLLMGKARVAPLKTVTIPRLELTAAMISVKVSTLLKRELEYGPINEYFWTDSKIVLGYLTNDSRRFHVFVANRVQQIREQTQPSQWRYVKTNVNPADEGSRGITAHGLVNDSRWLTGPEFLWQPEIPQETLSGDDTTLRQDDPEVKQVKVHATLSENPVQTPLLERLERLSDWPKVRRAVSVCLKLKSKLKNGTVKLTTSKVKTTIKYQPSMVEELSQAETFIIRLVQEFAFKDEIATLNKLPRTSTRKDVVMRKSVMRKTSSLYRLDPFLDDDGILRVGGRIRRAGYSDSDKHPAILPRKHHITTVIIRHFHEKTQHQGRGMTSNAIRSAGYWIIGGRSEISSYISKCVKCRKLRSCAMQQKMADLPIEIIEPAPPFTNCGVDYFGPFYIKEGRKILKRYGVLFTCLASRAIHIETAVALTTDSFINALRRFLAVRGPIRQLRSDQGTNFVGANREMKEAISEISQDSIRDFLLTQNCDFFETKMNVPASSHMGGVWERQIRTVRSVLSSILDQESEQLDDESLRTFMYEVMAIINSRPLTTDDLSDPLYPKPLTPNQLLTMKSTVILPPPGNFVREDLYLRKRWRRVQHLANEFWTRWKKEYLQTLQVRQKWTRPHRNIEVGDVVIIKDSNLPRNQWRLARVLEAEPDKDGHVRTAKLLMADSHLDRKGKRVNSTSYLERPIHKLVLLLENE